MIVDLPLPGGPYDMIRVGGIDGISRCDNLCGDSEKDTRRLALASVSL